MLKKFFFITLYTSFVYGFIDITLDIEKIDEYKEPKHVIQKSKPNRQNYLKEYQKPKSNPKVIKTIRNLYDGIPVYSKNNKDIQEFLQRIKHVKPEKKIKKLKNIYRPKITLIAKSAEKEYNYRKSSGFKKKKSINNNRKKYMPGPQSISHILGNAYHYGVNKKYR